jgi:mono/diheme cytochrome c family protein
VASALVLALVGFSGCSRGGSEKSWNFERMLDQRRANAFAASKLFADGKVMRTPPQGTVPYGASSDGLRQAMNAGSYASRIPLAVDRALLERGRDRFGVFCAPCHGVAGDGESLVAEAMVLRRPPSLVAVPILGFPVGRLYQVVTEGYGLMPSYAAELDVRDRWAVVGYVVALGRSRSARLADLTPEIREQLAKDARR